MYHPGGTRASRSARHLTPCNRAVLSELPVTSQWLSGPCLNTSAAASLRPQGSRRTRVQDHRLHLDCGAQLRLAWPQSTIEQGLLAKIPPRKDSEQLAKAG